MTSHHATTDVRITVEAGLIRVVYRGKVVFDRTTAMLREVARVAAETGTSSLLFDIRDADYRQYHLEAIEHTKQGPSLGISPAFRIAFLGSKGEAMLGFVENVTANRGYRSRAFTDEREAVAWLLGDAARGSGDVN